MNTKYLQRTHVPKNRNDAQKANAKKRDCATASRVVQQNSDTREICMWSCSSRGSRQLRFKPPKMHPRHPPLSKRTHSCLGHSAQRRLRRLQSGSTQCAILHCDKEVSSSARVRSQALPTNSMANRLHAHVSRAMSTVSWFETWRDLAETATIHTKLRESTCLLRKESGSCVYFCPPPC